MENTIYRIQERKFSSDIIEFSMNNGKTWKPLLAPFLSKKMGDGLAELMLEWLKLDALGIDEKNGMFYENDNTNG